MSVRLLLRAALIALMATKIGVKHGPPTRRHGAATSTMWHATQRPSTIVELASRTGVLTGQRIRRRGAASMRRRAVPRHPSIVKLDMLNGKQVGHLRRKTGVVLTSIGLVLQPQQRQCRPRHQCPAQRKPRWGQAMIAMLPSKYCGQMRRKSSAAKL